MSDAVTTKAPLQPFSYAPPDAVGEGKDIVLLAQTDRMIGIVQVMAEGGEPNLHAHPHMDGFWMVLKGRARFYGEDGGLVAEAGPHQGVLVPRGARYRWESSGEEALEILTVSSFSIALPDNKSVAEDREDLHPRAKEALRVRDGRRAQT